MADGFFERGEIYAIRMDNGVGSEEGMFRPGVIVSSNKGNSTSPTVIVCYLTTKFRRVADFSLETMATGLRSWILVTQIVTVDKTRIGKWLGVLNENELAELGKKLKETLDLTAADQRAISEKEREIHKLQTEMDDERAELKAKIAELERKLTTKNDSVVALEVENEMWKRLYGKALDQVVDMKLTGDIQRRIEKPPVTAATGVGDAPAEEPQEEIDERLDINSCTVTALKKAGFAPALAKTVVAKRPYAGVDDLRKVPGMKATMYKIVEPKLKCTPIKTALPEPDPGYEAPEPVIEVVTTAKVNVNTASAQEISEKTGMSMTVAYGIVGKRKRDGAYKTLEDLLNGKRFTQYHLDTYGAMLEV